MVNIAICDDLEPLTDYLKDKIKFAKACESMDLNISTYNTIKDIIEDLNVIKFDIVFMDINWNYKEITGFELADKIKKELPDCLMVYVSFYDCYYKKMVNHEPFRFLHKPIQDNKLEEVLSLAFQRISTNNEYYSFTYDRVLQIIRIKDIKYVCSDHRKLVILMYDKTCYTVYKKLDDFEEEIKERYEYFVRIGKSYLINYLHVTAVRSDSVEFRDGESLSYSKKYAKQALRQISELVLHKGCGR